MRLRKLFVVAHSGLFLAALFVFLADHGGVRGDYEFVAGNDVITSPADVGQVFFNRWQFIQREESWIVQTFLYLNVPSFASARFMVSSLGLLVDELTRTFPYGLSFSSYIVSLGLPFTFLQWYLIGHLAERLVTRKKGASRAYR